mgnify:CR=1 FL=1
MKNDVIISKMINYVEKILKYTDGMKYSEFESKDMVVDILLNCQLEKLPSNALCKSIQRSR